MIDLQNIKTHISSYEIKLEDGTILHIKRPSQAMLLQMMDLQKQSDNPTEAMVVVFDIVLAIFNNNVDNKVFTAEEITQMLDFQMAAYIIQDYLEENTKQLGK